MFKDWRITAEIVVLLLVVALVLALGLKIKSWHDAAQQNESRGQVLTATSGISADADQSAQQKAATDTGVTTGRDAYQHQIEEIKNHEPATRDWGTTPVPDSLRNAAHARRIARERSGRAALDGEVGHDPPGAAQR